MHFEQTADSQTVLTYQVSSVSHLIFLIKHFTVNSVLCAGNQFSAVII